MLGVSIRKMKALTIQMQKECRQNLTCFVYYVHEIVKYFFLADVFSGGLLRFG